MAQTYPVGIAHERMEKNTCPECGQAPDSHIDDGRFWIPRRCDLIPRGVWDRIEQYRTDKAATVDEPKRRGAMVRDKDGDLWKRGNTRWTCQAPIDAAHARVGRLPWFALVRQYGPLALVEDTEPELPTLDRTDWRQIEHALTAEVKRLRETGATMLAFEIDLTLRKARAHHEALVQADRDAIDNA